MRTFVHHLKHKGIIGFGLLYAIVLAFVVHLVSFSEEDETRRYIAEISARPPALLPPLPYVRTINIPDIVMRRDPFQRDAASAK